MERNGGQYLAWHLFAVHLDCLLYTSSGFKFRLYGTSTTGQKVDLTATTNSSDKASFTGVYVGTYTLEEVDPGAAYIKPSSKTVTISANSTTGAAYTSTVNMDNVWKHWYVTVTKVDAETGKTSAAMAGAKYTLYRSGAKVATYTVGSNGTFVTDDYPCTNEVSFWDTCRSGGKSTFRREPAQG